MVGNIPNQFQNPIAANNANTSVQTSQVPVLVKVISVLYFIISALVLVGMIILLISIRDSSEAGVIILTSIFLLGAGILFFFTALGLWKGDAGARITLITISILTILLTIGITILLFILAEKINVNENQLGMTNILSIFDISHTLRNSIILIIINGLIAGYMIFSNRVKEAFKKI